MFEFLRECAHTLEFAVGGCEAILLRRHCFGDAEDLLFLELNNENHHLAIARARAVWVLRSRDASAQQQTHKCNYEMHPSHNSSIGSQIFVSKSARERTHVRPNARTAPDF